MTSSQLKRASEIAWITGLIAIFIILFVSVNFGLFLLALSFVAYGILFILKKTHQPISSSPTSENKTKEAKTEPVHPSAPVVSVSKNHELKLFGLALFIVGLMYAGWTLLKPVGANMETYCDINLLGIGNCKFTNKGHFSEKACVKVKVISKTTKSQQISSSICSGSVESYESKNIQYNMMVNDIRPVNWGQTFNDVCEVQIVPDT